MLDIEALTQRYIEILKKEPKTEGDSLGILVIEDKIICLLFNIC